MSALQLELAKCLQLVVPASMTADDRAGWIAAAVEALADIRVDEIAAVSVELRRTVTRPNQIVPEIAKLVAEKRKRSTASSEPSNDLAAAERRINLEAHDRYGKARNQDEVQDAYWWERNARKAAGLPVAPIPPPLTRDELRNMPADIVSLGLDRGFLERVDGVLVETNRYIRP